MFHDMLRHPKFDSYDLRSLSRVGFAGMTMTPALIERCLDQLEPDLFVNYYGSSEIYTFSYCDHLDRKPGCAGRAGMNQIIRVVSPSRDDDIEIDLEAGVAGEIVASMRSPEAFSGYWKRPDAMPRRSKAAGTAPAISESSTRMASSTSWAASTT